MAETPIESFRRDDAKRTALRRLLENPLMREALALCRSRFIPAFPKLSDNADVALALSLQYSYLAGAHQFPTTLEALTNPPTDKTLPPLSEWGTLKPDQPNTHERAKHITTRSNNQAESGHEVGATDNVGQTDSDAGNNPVRKRRKKAGS